MHPETFSPAYMRFLLLKDLLRKSFHLAHKIFPQGGTCLEFGVFRGDSYVFQAHEISKRYTQSKLIGFDSWQGLPKETTGIWSPDCHNEGNYAAPKDGVLNRLKGLPVSLDDPRFRFVDGFFEESLTAALQSSINDLIFVNIDVDLHSSTITLLNFIKPLLRPGVVLYWDDWKNPFEKCNDGWGEHLAFKEWSDENPDVGTEFIDDNWVLQRIMVVTEANGQKLPLSALEDARKMSRQLDSLKAMVERKSLHNPFGRWLGNVVYNSVSSRGDTPREGSSK